MRSFRPFTWLLLGFLIALISVSASAETIPATKLASTTLWNPDVCTGAPYSATASTVSALHSLYIQNWTVPCSDGVVRQVTSDVSVYNETSGGYFQVNYSVPGQNFISGQLAVSVNHSCPSGYTISSDGLSCSRPDCPVGTEHNSAGDCITPCPPSGDTSRSGEQVTYSTSVSASGTCLNGCSYSFQGVTRVICASDACFKLSSVGSSNGQSCGSTDVIPYVVTLPPLDPSDEPLPVANDPEAPGTGEAPSSEQPQTTEEGCIAQGKGYVTMSGVTTCVPLSTGEEKVITPGKESTPKPDGSVDEKETTTSQNPDGSITETIGNCTRYPDGSQICNEPTTTNYSSEGDYCRSNPTAEICKKSTVAGGGTCEAAPTCTGDAATCAILRQQWESRCEIKKQNDFVGTAGDPGEFESKITAIDLKKTELGNLIDQIRGEAAGLFTFSGPGAATLGCDTGVTTTQGFHVELCFSKYDDELQMIGAVLVFVSLVIAVFIMFS